MLCQIELEKPTQAEDGTIGIISGKPQLDRADRLVKD